MHPTDWLTIRKHRCGSCGATFRSIQMPVTPEVASMLTDALSTPILTAIRSAISGLTQHDED